MEQRRYDEPFAKIAPGINSRIALEIWQDSIVKLWDVVDNLTQLRPEHTEFYGVTIFGSSRLTRISRHYDEVRTLARELAAMGCRIITGGGPGLMQAANEGALDANPTMRETSIGLNIHLPLEQTANTFVGRAYEHRTFFSRLQHFVLRSNAFIAVSGGIGTLLEIMMIWQLLQVGHLYKTPLILIGPMWNGLLDWARTSLIEGEEALADPLDLEIPCCVEKAEDAVEIIRLHYSEWLAQGEW
ncbi:MAG: LOG family protein [Armatimonadota bacterium]|nr:LOG family protein [bacterium]